MTNQKRLNMLMAEHNLRNADICQLFKRVTGDIFSEDCVSQWRAQPDRVRHREPKGWVLYILENEMSIKSQEQQGSYNAR